jgi:hypothetical protein
LPTFTRNPVAVGWTFPFSLTLPMKTTVFFKSSTSFLSIISDQPVIPLCVIKNIVVFVRSR